MVEHKRAIRNIQCLLRPRLRTGIPFITTTPPYWPKPKSQGQARLKGWRLCLFSEKNWKWHGYRIQGEVENWPSLQSTTLYLFCLQLTKSKYQWPWILSLSHLLPNTMFGHKSPCPFGRESAIFCPNTLAFREGPKKAAGPSGRGKKKELLNELFKNFPAGRARKKENRGTMVDHGDTAMTQGTVTVGEPHSTSLPARESGI